MRTHKKFILQVVVMMAFLGVLSHDAWCWDIGEVVKLRAGYLFCESKEDFDKTRDLIRDNDWEAVLKYASITTCGLTKEGVEAYIVGAHLFHGSFEVRPKGEVPIFWVQREAVPDDKDDSVHSVEAVDSNVSQEAQIKEKVKIEGIMEEKGNPVVYVSINSQMKSIKIGDQVCGGELIRVYFPGELDGITSKQSIDGSVYRIKMKFGDEESIFKNGDVICENVVDASKEKSQDRNSTSFSTTTARSEENSAADELRFKENLTKADAYYEQAQDLLRASVIPLSSYENIINLYNEAIREANSSLNKTSDTTQQAKIKEFLSAYRKEREQMMRRRNDLADSVKKAKSNNKIVLGMTKSDVVQSIGNPNGINKSNYSGTSKDQWVYGDVLRSALFLYFEDGILTSFQRY